MFKSNHLFLGTIEGGSSNNTMKWSFKEGYTKNDIERVQTDCYCSGAIVVDDGIIASFNELETKQWDENALAQNKTFYPEGYVVSRNITVYLKDGKLENLQRADGGYYPNPAKDRIILSFSAFIKF